jgi:hypothetical protein
MKTGKVNEIAEARKRKKQAKRKIAKRRKRK